RLHGQVRPGGHRLGHRPAHLLLLQPLLTAHQVRGDLGQSRHRLVAGLAGVHVPPAGPARDRPAGGVSLPIPLVLGLHSTHHAWPKSQARRGRFSRWPPPSPTRPPPPPTPSQLPTRSRPS